MQLSTVGAHLLGLLSSLSAFELHSSCFKKKGLLQLVLSASSSLQLSPIGHQDLTQAAEGLGLAFLMGPTDLDLKKMSGSWGKVLPKCNC